MDGVVNSDVDGVVNDDMDGVLGVLLTYISTSF